MFLDGSTPDANMFASYNFSGKSASNVRQGEAWTITMQHLPLPPLLAALFAVSLVPLVADPWNSVSPPMKILVYLMFLDYITGIVAAWITRRLSSKIGGRGLFRKGMIIVLLMSADLLEKALLTNLHLQLIGTLAYCANEFISIIENCAVAGIPIPKPLILALLNLKQFRFQNATDAELARLRTDDALAAERSRKQEPSEQ